MDQFSNYLWEAKKKKGYLFVPYLALGDPDWESSLSLARALFESGADTIEIGLPFTDPVADGPLLQRVFKKVLSSETDKYSLSRVYDFLARLKSEFPDKRFVVMGYANIFYSHRFSSVFKKLASLNVAGVIIPDIPYEEKQIMIKRENLSEILKKISWIDFVTPTTDRVRMETTLKHSSGFVYFVSTKGVTGQDNFNIKQYKKLISHLKKVSGVPVLIGFGIKNRQHADQAVTLADGFIVGSKIHETIGESTPRNAPNNLRKMVSGLLP